jgi:hypothetical protein
MRGQAKLPSAEFVAQPRKNEISKFAGARTWQILLLSLRTVRLKGVRGAG